MFIAGGTCTDVAGPIKPGDTCDIWTPRDGVPARAERLSARITSKAAGTPDKGNPYVAGLMVRAADTGRVLMLQRALSDDDVDGAAGKWEPPGGHVEAGETLAQGALREWSEETGFAPPSLRLVGSWDSSDGVYRGFVAEIAAESALDLENGRDQVDNPDGDVFESVAWLDPGDFADNPSLRPEVQRDLAQVMAALGGEVAKSAQTPVVSTVHHPLGHEGLWHTPSKKVPQMQQLPAYHQNTARALMRDQGMGESQAIATAINAIREWKAGRAFGGRVKVTPEVQAAAAKADAEFEQLRAAHH
jgi:8-oxo-dGTP pyrophosphatase MutT (NUDIX family)